MRWLTDRLIAWRWMHACCRCQRDRPGHDAECQWLQVRLCRHCRREITA